MYPLDRGVWGPITRISQLRDELARLADLDVIDGERGARRGALVRYAFSGRIRRLDGIYVETSSTLPSETDIAFLALARLLGIRALTYVRDAQYHFGEYYVASSLKRRIARGLFRPSVWALRSASWLVGYPSLGLARAAGDRSPAPLLLPPGSPPPVDVPMDPGARSLLFVGGLRVPAHGLDLLVGAVEAVRAGGRDLRVICVSRPGEEPAAPPPWMRVERGSGRQIVALLPDVVATVQPRRRTPYNDLAVPIKVMEYLSYGRPLLVTDCSEQAAIVRDADCGIVVADSVGGLAAGIEDLLVADDATRARWSANARRAALRHSWQRRAARIADLLMGRSDDGAS
jgi:glycosyltransferase involved in cell wall biosynthesis